MRTAGGRGCRLPQGIAGHFPFQAALNLSASAADRPLLKNFYFDASQPDCCLLRGGRLAVGPVCVGRLVHYV
jgi:hypothetical protein